MFLLGVALSIARLGKMVGGSVCPLSYPLSGFASCLVALPLESLLSTQLAYNHEIPPSALQRARSYRPLFRTQSRPALSLPFAPVVTLPLARAFGAFPSVLLSLAHNHEIPLFPWAARASPSRACSGLTMRPCVRALVRFRPARASFLPCCWELLPLTHNHEFPFGTCRSSTVGFLASLEPSLLRNSICRVSLCKTPLVASAVVSAGTVASAAPFYESDVPRGFFYT